MLRQLSCSTCTSQSYHSQSLDFLSDQPEWFQCLSIAKKQIIILFLIDALKTQGNLELQAIEEFRKQFPEFSRHQLLELYSFLQGKLFFWCAAIF